MREILFRAYDKGRKEYLSDGYLFIAINKSRNPNKSEIYLDEISNPDKYTERFVIEQYTGLTDKNGTKIFEGDIVKTKKYGKIIGHSNVNGFDIFVVIYESAMFRLENTHRAFNLVGKCGKGIDYEIIGNVHDNPELLEVEDNDR